MVSTEVFVARWTVESPWQYHEMVTGCKSEGFVQRFIRTRGSEANVTE